MSVLLHMECDSWWWFVFNRRVVVQFYGVWYLPNDQLLTERQILKYCTLPSLNGCARYSKQYGTEDHSYCTSVHREALFDR